MKAALHEEMTKLSLDACIPMFMITMTVVAMSVITMFMITMSMITMSVITMSMNFQGAGTAIGELPPYFMARAAKLSGTEDELDDDELEEILDIEEKERDHPESIKHMVSGPPSIYQTHG